MTPSGRTPHPSCFLLLAALVVTAGLPQSNAARAGEAFIPPIITASITGIVSEPLAEGHWLVTIEADIANSSDELLEDLAIMLLDGGLLHSEAVGADVALGTMTLDETRSVVWEVEAFAPFDAEIGLLPLFAGSAAGDFNERRAVWVESLWEAAQ